jgi:hypothetical protein
VPDYRAEKPAGFAAGSNGAVELVARFTLYNADLVRRALIPIIASSAAPIPPQA